MPIPNELTTNESAYADEPDAPHEIPEATEEDSELHRYVRRRLANFQNRILRRLATHTGNMAMAVDCACLATGNAGMIVTKKTYNPHRLLPDAAMVSVKYFGNNTHRAAVNRMVKSFTDGTEAPPPPGQRGDAGRRAMALARISQGKNQTP